MSPVSKALLLLGCLSVVATPSLATALGNSDGDRQDRPFLCGGNDGEDGDDDDGAGGLCGLEIAGIAVGVLGLGLVLGGSSKSN